MFSINTNKAFTIIELLIVAVLISIIALSFFFIINPFKQIDKANDSKRKHELQELSKVFNDFYNDFGRYPIDGEICYQGAIKDNDICSCFICGNHPSSPKFRPYIEKLPCDPQYPKKTYLYQYQCSSQQWFKLYAQLSENKTETTNSYSYGTSSQNIQVEPYPSLFPNPTNGPRICSGAIYCIKGGKCNICEPCELPNQEDCCKGERCDLEQLYDDSKLPEGTCVNPCIKI